jgi:PAS domain S-box-containing protein
LICTVSDNFQGKDFPTKDAAFGYSHANPEGKGLGVNSVATLEAPANLLGLAQLDQTILDALPIGVYFCDADGAIVRVNRAAQELWGRKPGPFESVKRFCGCFHVEDLNGNHIPADKTPMAQAVRYGTSFKNVEARVENPDGRQWIASVTIEPLLNEGGELIGAVNCFQDVTQQFENRQQLERQRKSFDLAMTASKMGTWRYTMADNICRYDANAQRLYALNAEEFSHDEEGVKQKFHADDLDRMWSRVAKACDPLGDGLYDVEYRVRQADGSWRWLSAWGYVEFEDAGGERKAVAITGASRDISDLISANEAQQLLIYELHHRVKNVFALASSVLTLSARSAETPKALARTVGERLGALARAHTLTLPTPSKDNPGQSAMLHALMGTIVSPFEGKTHDGKPRIAIAGSDIAITGQAVTSFALLLHEFATNAAKYGALSVPDGYIEIASRDAGETVEVTWLERRGPAIGGPIDEEGFGSLLTRMTVSGQLNGRIERDWRPDGLFIQMTVDRARLG